jgi:ABC-2 type transport system permease protein
VGALLWGYLSLVFMEAAYAISWERWEGTIEYTFMAPVRRVTHLFGICFFAIGYGLARTFAVLLIATLMFRLDSRMPTLRERWQCWPHRRRRSSA